MKTAELPASSVNVMVVDRTSDSPSGYELMFDPNVGQASLIKYIPHFSDLPEGHAKDIFEAAYRLTPHYYGYDENGLIQRGKLPKALDDMKRYYNQIYDKQNLQRGLLLINELLKTASPDAERTRTVREWSENTHRRIQPHDLDAINALQLIIATDVDNAPCQKLSMMHFL